MDVDANTSGPCESSRASGTSGPFQAEVETPETRSHPRRRAPRAKGVGRMHRPVPLPAGPRASSGRPFVLRIYSFGLTSDRCLGQKVREHEERGVRAQFDTVEISAAVSRVWAQCPIMPVAAIDCRDLSRGLPRDQGRVVTTVDRMHSGWHPEHLHLNVSSGNLARLAKAFGEDQWSLVLDAGSSQGVAAVVCYCREGNVRSVAMTRHLRLALASCGHPWIEKITIDHVSLIVGRWRASGRCGGPVSCCDCVGRVADRTFIETVRAFRCLWHHSCRTVV